MTYAEAQRALQQYRCPAPECARKTLMIRSDGPREANGQGGFYVVCGGDSSHPLMKRQGWFEEYLADWRRGDRRGLGIDGMVFVNALIARSRREPRKWSFEVTPLGEVYRIGSSYAPWYDHGLSEAQMVQEVKNALVTRENIQEKLAITRFMDRENPDSVALQRLAEAAVAYDLDPVMGEITLYEGRPYIQAVGWRRKVLQSPVFDGESDQRMLPPEEIKQRGFRCFNHSGACPAMVVVGLRVYRKGIRHVPEVYGAACPVHPYRSNPVEAKDPNAMAYKRAFMRGARNFQDQLPQGMAQMLVFEEAAFDVDPETGEIHDPPSYIETTARDVTDAPAPAAPVATPQPADPWPATDAEPEAETDPVMKYLSHCPDHDIEWFKTGGMRDFAHRFHNDDGAEEWCNRRGMLAKKFREARELVGMDQGQATAWAKDEFGKPPSAMEAEEMCRAILALKALVYPPAFPDDEEGEAEE